MGPGKLAAQYTHTHGSKVSEVMTTNLRTVSEDTPLEKIVEMMERYRIKRVPVLRGKKVVGIVTRANLMHAMVSLARLEPKSAKNDSAIRQKTAVRIKKGKVGFGVDDQCRCARRRGGIMGHDRRRPPARGTDRRCRKYARC